jgi:hypothetical protein
LPLRASAGRHAALGNNPELVPTEVCVPPGLASKVNNLAAGDNQLECFLLAVKHCNRSSHKTAMTSDDGYTYKRSSMYDIEEHLEDLINAARRRLRERTDDGAGEVS